MTNHDENWGPLRPLDDRSYAEPQTRLEPRRKRSLGRWGAIGALCIALLSKTKFLVAGLKFLKLGSLISMLVTIGAYALFFGWPFAVGFVALIFVHEMGHAIALRQQGIPAGAPVFVPFMGAFIAMKGRPRDAFVEAYVGIGGPVLGTAAAAVCLVAAIALKSDFLYALASVGFLLNLFNMIPISPLDGGRVAGAISRWFWVPGFALAIGAFVLTWSPILMLILILGLFTIYSTWKRPVPGYYDIAGWKRATMGAAYFGLLIAMVFGMTAADANLQHIAGGQMAAAGGLAAMHVFGGALIERVRARG